MPSRLDGLQARPFGPRLPSPVFAALAFLALVLVAPALFADAYAVKLKDGSLLFARVPYAVKGTHAIITLENGTVTQLPLAQVDEPGTERYNRENFGNAIAIPTPRENVLRLPARPPQSVAASSGSGSAVDSVLWGGPAVRARRPQKRDARRAAALSIP
jgi:hypothetical protein